MNIPRKCFALKMVLEAQKSKESKLLKCIFIFAFLSCDHLPSVLQSQCKKKHIHTILTDLSVIKGKPLDIYINNFQACTHAHTQAQAQKGYV